MSIQSTVRKDWDYLQAAVELSREFATNAVERDREGGNAFAELEKLRESGLLKLNIPTEFGGFGKPWSAVMQVIREFAKVDGSFAHLFGYHCLNMTIVHLTGTPEQAARLYTETANNNWFWGNANNSLDRRVVGRENGDHYVLNGIKGFTSGSPYADILLISFRDQSNEDIFHRAVIPAERQGVIVHNDWDAIGQRQTGSGTLSYQDAIVHKSELIDETYRKGTVLSTFPPILAQLVLSNLFVGSAQGAIAEAAQYTRTQSRPWVTSGVERANEDPIIIRQYGELGIELEAAVSLVDRAIVQVDKAYAQGFDMTAEERGEAGYIVTTANVFSGNASLNICSRVFEVMGARASANKYGFDRFWRNVRTHTLHNPAEYKVLTAGHYVLNGQLPRPGIFS
ncbi:acyl-CoA dehydrogenase family protein [Cohnella sp. WQ 127256]|uniref:acyl-CoA dehydrogenase family protein n=1 Tax=Cohnella sp. WQ 127256 TaxID=2938790 RepID=UPI002117FBC9|nr:acyl-CoA dehydrogenase family protein [Cohnella sp. WQ 127256]